jgi:hypothetical protein
LLIAGVLVRAIDFRDATLVVLVSERADDVQVTLRANGRGLDVRLPAGEARMLLVDRAGQVQDGTVAGVVR